LKQIGLLKNPVQNYAWGSRTALHSFLGLPEPWREPVAEVWLGAHAKAPSKVRVNGEWRSLIDLLRADPVSVLGKQASRRFDGEFPFLLKILVVEHPLSLQVHPHKDQAETGFHRENQLNIPLDAPNRNYRDSNHKPEFLCAVTRFEAMKGFRNPKNILELMDAVLTSTSLPELDLLRNKRNAEGMKRFFSSLVTMDSERRDRVIKEVAKKAEPMAAANRAFHWVLKLKQAYPRDIGVLSPLFLNLVELSPEEAIYVPAGELHAYLSGVAMEIMASSDNVLRGGLTPKHVDIGELLKILNFNASPVHKQNAFVKTRFERIYKTPAHEFQLSKIVLTQGEAFESEAGRSVEILLCMEGEGAIEDLHTGRSLPLHKGSSVIVPSRVPRYSVSGDITLFKGSVGV
jgi:mannose-6-phosphate isomerase